VTAGPAIPDGRRGAPAASPEELAWLERACALALRGRGRCSPNPLVGAVLAREGRVLGEGWHEGPGTAHAEVAALRAARAAGADPRGAAMAVTLEPCSHHGRTPPCVDALLEAGVGRVVIGCLDPLERRRGQGARILADAGVEVALAEGAAAAASREAASAFLTWAVTGRPMVTLKLAASLDGKVATAGGESRWISGPEARALVHRWRADSDAVAVGIGTALADDPLLTARDVEGEVRQPLRVVFDATARLPLDAALVRGAGETPTLVVAGPAAPRERVAALRAAGVEVLALDERDAGLRLAAALEALGDREAQSLLVEGGPRLAAAFVAAGLVDRLEWVLAPILIGGVDAPGALAGAGLGRLAEAPRLHAPRVERLGEDVLVSGRLRPVPGG
jgi:diaminohydroxyphosphoribosylaminopyrimidine deaminase / 5-amino-6-(5-phosphoribosylamino)uracil reductase